MSDDAARTRCEALFDKVLAKAATDPSMPPYVNPFRKAELEPTLEGCRADLPDGRYMEISSAEVRFGRVNFSGSRRVPL